MQFWIEIGLIWSKSRPKGAKIFWVEHFFVSPKRIKNTELQSRLMVFLPIFTLAHVHDSQKTDILTEFNVIPLRLPSSAKTAAPVATRSMLGPGEARA